MICLLPHILARSTIQTETVPRSATKLPGFLPSRFLRVRGSGFCVDQVNVWLVKVLATSVLTQ